MSQSSSDTLVRDAKSKISVMDGDTLEAQLASGEAVAIDVRDGDERQTKPSIPGSHHASRGLLEFYIDQGSAFHMDIFKTDKTLVFVCGSGARAALAAATAQQMGLRGLSYLEGGMKGWIADGRALVDIGSV